MDIEKQQNYLKSIYAHSGLYIITPQYEFSKTNKMNIKIGIADDLHHRFGAYLLCYPIGFFIFRIFLTYDKEQAARLERSIHKYLNAKYKNIVTKHSHSEETFSLTLQEVSILINTIEANIGIKFRKGDDIINGQDQVGKSIFPYIDTLPEIFLNENLAQGGHRVKAFNTNVKDFIDSNYNDNPIPTSQKKTKHKSITMPQKGLKIPGMAALPYKQDEEIIAKKKINTKKKKKMAEIKKKLAKTKNKKISYFFQI